MKKILYCFLLSFAVASCGPTKSITPLGEDKVKIDISAPSSYSRAEAQAYANKKAAEATLEMGFERFRVLSARARTEEETYRDTFHDYSIDPFYDDFYYKDPFHRQRYTATYTTVRNPEATMVIKLYNRGQKDFQNAIDANQYLSNLERK